MTEQVVLTESCSGFWTCIDANTILISLITLTGVFASSLLTYYLTSRQHKIDVFVNHKDFYSSIDGLDKWIPELTDRISKISAFESLSNLEILKDEAGTLDYVGREVIGNIQFEDAPYPLRKPLMRIMKLTLQVRGFSTSLIERIENGSEELINLSEIEKKYKVLNKEIKKNHRIIKKYL